MPNAVTTVGTTSAATQHAPTKDQAAVPAPRSLARPTSQADAQIAPRTIPGRTSGTSRRLAHGWSGTVAGHHSTAAAPQPMIASGNAQLRAAPVTSFQVSRARKVRRTSRARPRPPSRTAGAPTYQVTQYSVSSAYVRVGSTGRGSSRCASGTDAGAG